MFLFENFYEEGIFSKYFAKEILSDVKIYITFTYLRHKMYEKTKNCPTSQRKEGIHQVSRDVANQAKLDGVVSWQIESIKVIMAA